jgi:hypothetical protein
MTSAFFRRTVVSGLGLALCAAAAAHHGTSTFDGNTIITLEGRVVRFNWTNPHGSLVLAVSEPGGVVEYFVEADGPSILKPLGVMPDSLVPGDRVIAYVSPSRLQNPTTVLGREVIKEDGSIVALSVAYARQRKAAAPPPATSVIGTWVPDQRSLFDFVRERNAWRLTAAGEASLAAYDIHAPFAQTECIPATAPTLLTYPTAKVLTDHGTTIELNADWMGATRTIYMDGRNHPPSSEQFLQGHSYGHWEGSKLLIDTTNFSPNAIGNAFGVASGVRKHLVEILSLNADGRSLTYSFTLEDPDYLLEPVMGSFQWHYRPDVTASTEACDLDSASRHLRTEREVR